jgi:ubiquinone/menaquinone biosynthesis C-methylase UbiE
VTQGHFAAIAQRYDALRSQLFEKALELLVRTCDPAGRRVLDLGCGTGRFAAALSERHGCAAASGSTRRRRCSRWCSSSRAS